MYNISTAGGRGGGPELENGSRKVEKRGRARGSDKVSGHRIDLIIKSEIELVIVAEVSDLLLRLLLFLQCGARGVSIFRECAEKVGGGH
jgi:hypothetical protein